MSKPRAATAVATKIGILPVLKSRKASSLLTSSSHVFHESWIYEFYFFIILKDWNGTYFVAKIVLTYYEKKLL